MGRVLQAMARLSPMEADLPAIRCSLELQPLKGTVAIMSQPMAHENLWPWQKELGQAWDAFAVPPPNSGAQVIPFQPKRNAAPAVVPPVIDVTPVTKTTITEARKELPPPVRPVAAPPLIVPTVLPEENKAQLAVAGKAVAAKSLQQLSAAARNEYKQLRNALVQAATKRKMKTFLLCGVEAENGVPQANLYLSEALAGFSAGSQVAHITLPEAVELEPEETQSLSGPTPDLSRQMVQCHTEHSNLRQIALPERPLTIAEAVAGNNLRTLLGRLKVLFDYILLDAPPVLLNPDTINLASRVDGVVLVARQHKTKLEDIAAAQEKLTRAGVEILGLVFNNQ